MREAPLSTWKLWTVALVGFLLAAAIISLTGCETGEYIYERNRPVVVPPPDYPEEGCNYHYRGRGDGWPTSDRAYE